MPGPPSKLEHDAQVCLVALRFPPWVRDYVFHPTRKWELDFAWPDLFVYLSIEGGIGHSSHRGRTPIYRSLKTTTGKVVKMKIGMRDGFAEDCMKHSEAAILGWIGIRATGSMISDGSALALLRRAIDLRRVGPF